jgi:hypothetical protein
MNLRCLTLGLFLFSMPLLAIQPAVASPGYLNKTSSPAFAASPELRPRINFWIDVFTRYGQHEVVFHHALDAQNRGLARPDR